MIMSTNPRTCLNGQSNGRRLHFVFATMVGFAVLLSVSSDVAGQEGDSQGNDLRAFGDMFRTYDQLYGVALQNFDDELRVLQSTGGTPGELEAAYERFRKISLDLDSNYKQPVIERIRQEANRRGAQHGTPVADNPDPRRQASPSTPIGNSSGSRPGDSEYRPWGADLDAAGGSRPIDHVEGIAREMGLTSEDGARLFGKTPAYSTTDNDRLQMTLHKSGALDRVGSNAWQTQIEVDALQPETAIHINMREGQVCREYVAVRDFQTKAVKGLNSSGIDLLPKGDEGINLKGAEKLQGMVKGTLKSLTIAELSDQALTVLIEKHGIGETPGKLRHILELLKSGRAIVPGSVGLTPDNIGQFQSLCGDIIDESAKVTKARADIELEEKLALRDRLEASGDPADRERAREVREEIIDSRKRMQEVDRAVVRDEIDQLQRQQDAITAPDDGKPLPPADSDADIEKKRKLAALDREIEIRRARQAVRDLYGDVERRKTVSGETVVADLNRPRSPRPKLSLQPPPEIPPTQRAGVLTHPVVQRGLLLGGGLVATYNSLKEEYYEAENRLREKRKGTPNEHRRLTFDEVMGEISYTRSAARTVLSLTGIEGAWLAGQKAKYEWVKGTNDYIDAEVDRYRRAGYEELPFGATLTIMMKATIRQATLSTYEGVKGVPILGDLVGMPENLYVVTESSVGILYDRWTQNQILSVNAEQAIKDARRASLTVSKLLRDMQNLTAAAEKQVRALESLRQLSIEAETSTEQLRDGFRADFQSLEKLVEQLGPNSETPTAVEDASKIGKMLNDVTTLIRESADFSRRCEQLERDLKAGRIECSAIREQDRDLSDQLTTLGYHRDNIQERYLALQNALQALGPAAEARQLVLRLRDTADYAGRVHENLTRSAGSVKQLTDNLRTLRANLDLVRQRVMSVHEKFSPRAAPGEDSAEWDRFLRQADDARIDVSAGKYAGAIEERLVAAAQHLRLVSHTELPVMPIALQPQRIGGQLSGDLDSLTEPIAAMTGVFENATEKFNGLRQLCPAPKSAFTLQAKTDEKLNAQFKIAGTEPAKGSKWIYVWDFGDDSREASPQSSQSHRYQKPGEYTVTVEVFEETETFSSQLGQAATRITLQSTATPHPRNSTAGAADAALTATWKLDIEPEAPKVNSLDEIGATYFRLPLPRIGGVNLTSVTFRHLPASQELEFELHAEVVVLFSHLGGYPTYRVEVSGRGRGPLDARSGQFRLPIHDISWNQDLPWRIPGSLPSLEGGKVRMVDASQSMSEAEHAEHLAQAYQLLGSQPADLDWSGTISGTIDWQNFGGGNGRIEINSIFQGPWEYRSLNPYTIPWPESIPRPVEFAPRIVLFPALTEAKRAFQRYRSLVGPRGQSVADLGDEAIVANGLHVRMGRWNITMLSRSDGMAMKPDDFRPILRQFQEYIVEQELETRFPAQPAD